MSEIAPEATPTPPASTADDTATLKESHVLRIVIGLLLSIFGGACLFFSFPQQGGIWPLVFIGFIPMYIAQYRVLPRKWSGVPLGIVFFAWWLGGLLTAASLSSMLVLVGGALAAGIIGGVIGIFQRSFSERTGYRWFLLQLPLIWVAIDLLTTNNYFGTQHYIAYHLGLVPQIIQPVSIVSTPALSFLIVLINSALALLIIWLMDRKWPQFTDVSIPKRALKWSLIIAGLVTVAWFAASIVIYNQVTAAMGPTVRIAAVIPGIENFQKSALQKTSTGPARTPAEVDAALQLELTQMTQQAANQGAQLIVWPEKTISYDPHVTNTEWIPALATANNVYIITGFTTYPLNKSHNKALMFGPKVGVMGVYSKVHPVLLEGETFVPGTTFPTFQTSVGPLGIIICWDMDFPDSAARLVTLTGSEIVVVPSIDFASVAKNRVGSNVFRAVENRVGIVKSDRAWDSRMVQPNGQVVARRVFTNPTGGKDMIIANVARGPGNAPFTQLGGGPFAALVGFFLIWMIAAMIISSVRSREARAK